MPTKIEWCDDTCNPIIGCSHTDSPGCAHCYAERQAFRLGWGGLCKPGPTRQAYKSVIDPRTHKWNGKTAIVENALGKLLHSRKPKTIFLCSMSDLFHKHTDLTWIQRIFRIMYRTPQHTFRILTKRPRRLRQLEQFLYGWAPHIQIGVSISTQDEADQKIPLLLRTQAHVKFLSIEPLLGPIDLYELLRPSYVRSTTSFSNIPALDWIIVGGETGPGARPMHPDLVRIIRDQCAHAKVPFFFKGWGEWGPFGINQNKEVCLETDPLNPISGTTPVCPYPEPPQQPSNGSLQYAPAASIITKGMARVGKKRAGNLLDGRTHQEFPKTTQ